MDSSAVFYYAILLPICLIIGIGIILGILFAIINKRARARPQPQPPTVQVIPSEPLILYNLEDCPEFNNIIRHVEEHCVVCLDKPPNVILVPCMHQCLCVEDVYRYHENICPICRQEIIAYLTSIEDLQ